MKELFRGLKKHIGKEDIILTVGLFMLGGGIYSRVPWLAFTIVGLILLIIGVIGASKPDQK